MIRLGSWNINRARKLSAGDGDALFEYSIQVRKVRKIRYIVLASANLFSTIDYAASGTSL